jgi:membrane protease YdiL (CAAX protease family)
MFQSNLVAPTRPISAIITLALIVAFSLPLAGWLVPGNSIAATIAREAVYWFMALAIVAYVLFVERRPLASIGFGRFTGATVGFGLAGAACAYAGMALLYAFVLPHVPGIYAEKTASLLAMPTALRVEIVLRAAVFEEIFYRGFLIERLTPVLRSPQAAALFSLCIFIAGHVGSWGWGSLFMAGFGGAVLTGLYLWKRDLFANIIAHGLTGAAALLT